jgi:ABC-type nitrate/sulfonate/bicarbonate transport system permease component
VIGSALIYTTLTFVEILLPVILLGLIFGITLGHLALQSIWLSRTLRRICRIALWIPLLVLWAAPIWFHPFNYSFLSYKLSVVGSGSVAVVASVVYHYLLISMAENSDTIKRLMYVSRAAIIHGLLASLVIHRLISSQSWFNFPASGTIRFGYLVVIILWFILFIVDYLIGPDIEESVGNHRKLMLYEMHDVRKGDVWQMVLLGAVFSLGWWIVSAMESGKQLISPLDALSSVASLIVGNRLFLEHGNLFWKDLGISLIEIVLGIVSGGGMAIFVSLLCWKKSSYRSLMLRVFGLTYVITIILPGFVMEYVQRNLDIWLSCGAVAAISFFPFLRALMASMDCPWGCRILLAVEEALPYGFVGMIFGESIQASAGLGLSMTIASATAQAMRGVAVAITVVSVFLILSVSVRGVLRQMCFGIEYPS